MASLFLCLLLLPAPAPLPDAGAVPAPLIRAIDLDARTLRGDPTLLAADTLALVVESRREAFYKLSEKGDILATGKLLPGANTVRFTRPGLTAGSQSLFFVLDLLEPDATASGRGGAAASGRGGAAASGRGGAAASGRGGAAAQKFLRVQVTVEGRPGSDAGDPAALSGSFRLEMYHSGRLFGFRKKNMVDLLKLRTGPVMPVPDPGLSGAAGRSPSAGNSVSLISLGMALAKFLAGKKAEKRLRAHAAEVQKKRLAVTIHRDQREIPIEIELRAE